MRDTLTLGELYRDTLEQDSHRKFVEVPDSWEFYFDKEPLQSEFHMGDSVFSMESVSAQKTVLKYLKVPYSYVASISPELAQQNISTMREDFKHPLIARVDSSKNAVVGVFSSKMERVSDSEILERLVESFGEDVPVSGGRLSYDSSSMDIRVRSGSVESLGTLSNGSQDELSFMLDISTSEACIHPITADFGIYRLVCANGMLRRDMGSEYLRSSYLRFKMDDLAASFQAVASQSDVYLSSWLKKLERAQQIDLGDPQKDGVFTEQFVSAVRNITSSRKFNSRLAEELVAKMELSGLGNSAYSFIQAVTAHAQTFEGKKRLNLEAAAGYFLDDILDAA